MGFTGDVDGFGNRVGHRQPDFHFDFGGSFAGGGSSACADVGIGGGVIESGGVVVQFVFTDAIDGSVGDGGGLGVER